MSIISTKQYSHAFGRYLRDGTPISLSLKQRAETEKYVWHTRGDDKVRISHRANNGRLFSWANPPDTQHPGEDYGCRCKAVPYIRGQTEFADHEITGNLASPGDKWGWLDFVRHFYTGQARGVKLSEIGHLRSIVGQYSYYDDSIGALRRLSDQIAQAARDQGSGSFVYRYDGNYEFEFADFPASFPHGRSVVSGEFIGQVTDRGSFLSVQGANQFFFEDVFTDPLDIRDAAAWTRRQIGEIREGIGKLLESLGLGSGKIHEPGETDPDDVSELFFLLTEINGSAYRVSGNWSSTFHAEFKKDPKQSNYVVRS